MKNKILPTIFIFAAFTSTVAVAAAPPQSVHAICPAPNTLTKDPKTMLWSAPGGWKSYQSSFANKMGKFMGAQWDGVEVGQVVCLYQPADPYAFVVQLFYNKIVFEPTNPPWSKNLKGYRNCASHNLNDCAFMIRLKPKGNKNIYQQLDNYKKDNSQANQQQGF